MWGFDLGFTAQVLGVQGLRALGFKYGTPATSGSLVVQLEYKASLDTPSNFRS